MLAAHLVEKVRQNADLNGEKESPKWISIAGGRDHSLAISEDKTVFGCGNNQFGQLGLPGLSQCLWFSKIHTLENGRFNQVFAGGDHSFALLDFRQPKVGEPAHSQTDIQYTPALQNEEEHRSLIQYDDQLLEDDDLEVL